MESLFSFSSPTDINIYKNRPELAPLQKEKKYQDIADLLIVDYAEMEVQPMEHIEYNYEIVKEFGIDSMDDVEAVTGFVVMRIAMKCVWHWFRRKFLYVVLISVLCAMIESMLPKIIEHFIDDIMLGQDFSRALFVLFGYVILSIIGVLFRKIINMETSYMATRIEDGWLYSGLKKIYDLPMDWHDNNESASAMTKLKDGAVIFWIIICRIGSIAFTSLFGIIAVLISVLFSAPNLFLLFLLPTILYLAVSQYFIIIMGNQYAVRRKFGNSATNTLADGLSNIKVIKIFASEREETFRYATRWNLYHLAEYSELYVSFLQTMIQGLIKTLWIFSVLYVGYLGVNQGIYTTGFVTLLLAYQAALLSPLSEINSAVRMITDEMLRLKSLLEIMVVKNNFEDRADSYDFNPSLQRGISLENVSFSYTKDVKALQNVCIEIMAGKTTAFVGHSGGGKTTLTKLLLRFHDPSEGRILWDGEDIRDCTQKSWRNLITVVPQETSLFNRTIKENIAFGKVNSTMEDIITASKKANSHEFIMKTPKGYDSMIGENGIKLSGGQRQRIAIARSLLANPAVLIFDESTSNLDSESEALIQHSISELQADGITQIIITHRLSTIKNADHIFVIDSGEIVDAGTHEELMESSAIYSSLYNLQYNKKHLAKGE